MEEQPKTSKRTGVYFTGIILLAVFFLALALYFAGQTPVGGPPAEQVPKNQTSENAYAQPDFRVEITGPREISLRRPAPGEERAQTSTRVHVENLSPDIGTVSLNWSPQPTGLDVEIDPPEGVPPFSSAIHIRVYEDFPSNGPFELKITGLLKGTGITRENTITLVVTA